jgi:hypothetical protein
MQIFKQLGIFYSRSMASLAEQFAAAQKKVGQLKEDPGNAEKLKLYAMFKQV